MNRLQDLLKQYYPGKATVAYASKAYFSQTFAAKLAALGAGSDVVSLGEIHVAQKAGFPAEVIHLHGNNKTEAELRAAIGMEYPGDCGGQPGRTDFSGSSGG